MPVTIGGKTVPHQYPVALKCRQPGCDYTHSGELMANGERHYNELYYHEKSHDAPAPADRGSDSSRVVDPR